jgi:hypothetical protein
MKKLLIVSAGFLFVMGFISIVWAHGPGNGSGYRSHGYSKPHFKRHSHPRVHQRHNKHFRHQHHNKHFRHYRPHRLYYGPLVRYYDYGYEDNPPREELPQAPQHTPFSRIYFSNNPEPWFLYGKGKEFRQMGLIPPLPQTSRELR